MCGHKDHDNGGIEREDTDQAGHVRPGPCDGTGEHCGTDKQVEDGATYCREYSQPQVNIESTWQTGQLGEVR